MSRSGIFPTGKHAFPALGNLFGTHVVLTAMTVTTLPLHLAILFNRLDHNSNNVPGTSSAETLLDIL